MDANENERVEREEGAADYRKGVDRNDDPYSPWFPARAAAWRDGWDAAQEQEYREIAAIIGAGI